MHVKVLEDYTGIHDVYQGQIWKDFLKVNGRYFLSAPYVYEFMLV